VKKVAIMMGSDSDFDRLEVAVKQLRELDIECEARVLSAHRTPDEVVEYVNSADERGIGVFLCAAGSAAHLAGVVSAHTLLPVIGIPMDNAPLGGLDALLSTVQMPGGIPVASVAVGGGGPVNAALMAARILAVGDPDLTARLVAFREDMRKKVAAKNEKLQARLG
jgi:5-(carboxyamino)imidazole ribonucleotide mutase